MSTEEQTVPLSRFQAKVEAFNALKKERDELAAKVGDVDGLAAKVEKYKADLKAERDAHAATKAASAETLTMVSAGIVDPDAQDLVRYRRGKLGDEAPPLEDYLAGAAREDRFLASLFAAEAPSPEPTEDAPAPTPEPTRAPPANDNAGTRPAPQPDGAGRLAEIQANMSNPEWLKANIQKVREEFGFAG